MVARESDDDADGCRFPAVRKTFWRSATWNETSASSSSSRTSPCGGNGNAVDTTERNSSSAPRSQDHTRSFRSRSPLLPLQPLTIARRSFDDWPSSGLDYSLDLTSPVTPGRRRVKAGLDIKLDLASVHQSTVEPTEIQLRRDKLALFDKQCSRVTNYHIFVGSDAVARDRDILIANGITHVLNCVGFICPEYFKRDFEYRTLWLQDSPCEDILSLLYDVFDYFEDVKEQGGKIFVHCCQGVSRSVSLVIAYVMWKESKTFEDAFQDVKAARGVANPNMGFACQLLQYQKKLFATPVSPKSALRLYRVAPHSPYDPLHLVLKACIGSQAELLDSRGTFVVHSHCALFLWIGRNCDSQMALEGEESVGQITKYERAEVPVKVLTEGNESVDFWNAFAVSPKVDDKQESKKLLKSIHKVDANCRSKFVELKSGMQGGAEILNESSNDNDYSLYHKARFGGVIPPVSPVNKGHGATAVRIPLHAQGWSMLRRKVSGRELLCSNTSPVEGLSSHIPSPNNSLDSSSPLFSPFSVTSVSLSTPAGSDSSFDSPLPLATVLPNSSATELVALGSHSSPDINYLHDSPQVKALAGSRGGKVVAPSLAVCQVSLSPCRHLSSSDDPPPAPRGLSRKPKLPPLIIMERHQSESRKQFCKNRHLVVIGSSDCADKSTAAKLPSRSGHFFGSKLEKGSCSLYLWPGLERVNVFDVDDLDTRGVFLVVETRCLSTDQRVFVYVWVGYQLAESKVLEEKAPADTKELAWHQVGQEFVGRMQLPADACIKVVKEGQEPEEFWKALSRG